MNINDLKNRLLLLNNRAAAKPRDLWKPKDEHVIRLLPYPFSEDPFLTLHFHYEIGDQHVLCPKLNHDEECIICDFCDSLKSWNDSSGNEKKESERKADWEVFKKIQPKARVFIPMVERGHEDDGAKFWQVSPNQAAEFLDICADGDRLAELGIAADDVSGALKVLFDPAKAYDVTVAFAKKGEKGNTTSYGQTTVKGKIKPTPLAKDKKSIDAILSSIKKIGEVYEKMSSAEVEKAFKKFVGNSSTAADPSVGNSDEKYAKSPANTAESAKVVGTKTIDEAFGELLSE